MCSARFDAILLGPGRILVSCPTFERHGKPWESVRFASERRQRSPMPMPAVPPEQRTETGVRKRMTLPWQALQRNQ